MSWARKALADLGTWHGGSTPSKTESAYWDGGSVPWLSPKDMGAKVLSGTQDHVTQYAVQSGRVRVVGRDSIAIVVRSGILERKVPIALVPFSTTLNQDMKALSVGPGVLPQWVTWALRSQEREILAEDRKSGTTVASLDSAKLMKRMIPLPSEEEQRQIVDILEDYLSRLDAAEHGLKSAERRVGVLHESAFTQLAGRSTGVVSLGEIASVGTGSTPLRSRSDYYDGGTVSWLTSGDLVQGGTVSPTSKVTEVAVREARLKLYPRDTLVLAMYGEGKTRGTVSRLDVESTMNQACAAIQVAGDDVDREWVRHALVASYRRLRSQAAGGVQPNMNLSVVRSIEIPTGSRSSRALAVRQLDEIDAARRRLESQLDAARTRSASLRRALLTAAFSGQLTGRASDSDRIEELADASHDPR